MQNEKDLVIRLYFLFQTYNQIIISCEHLIGNAIYLFLIDKFIYYIFIEKLEFNYEYYRESLECVEYNFQIKILNEIVDEQKYLVRKYIKK